MDKINFENPIVCFITGPAGAGKSTVSKVLAEKFAKSAVIDVDYLRSMIVGGYVKPWPHNEEAGMQISLGIKNSCSLANNFLEQGFSVFINGVVGTKDLKEYYDFFGTEKLKVFLLLPSKEVLLDRFDKRGIDDALRTRTYELHNKFVLRKDELKWTVIDSSNQTMEETADFIFNELNR